MKKSQYSLRETFSKNLTIAKTENNFSMKTLQTCASAQRYLHHVKHARFFTEAYCPPQ